MKKNQHAVELGRLGGKKGGVIRSQNLSPERRKEIAQKAANARWKKENQFHLTGDPIMMQWCKKLTRSDAQQDTQGAKMSFLRFTKGNLQVDHTVYFRDVFFQTAGWHKPSNVAETIVIDIDVKLPMHSVPIRRQMHLDYDPNRSENHSAPTVHLMYDQQTRLELEEHNWTDHVICVSSNNGQFSLVVS